MISQRRGFGEALALLAFASLGSTSSNSTSDPWGEPPEGVRFPYNITDYFTRAPNATGSWPIKGVDLTRGWEGNDSIIDDGWELFTSYWADVDTVRGETYNPTRTWLRVPPDTFSGNELDDNWALCVYQVRTVLWSEEDAQTMWDEDDDGNCAGVVPQQCIDDTIRAAEMGDEMCRGVPINSIESCHDSTSNGWWSLVPDTWNGTEEAYNTVALNENGTSTMVHYENYPDSHYADDDKDEETQAREFYDYGMTEVVPHIITYKYFGGGSNQVHSVFKCTRPNRIAEGSRGPESMGDRDAAGMLKVPLTAVILGSLAISLIGA